MMIRKMSKTNIGTFHTIVSEFGRVYIDNKQPNINNLNVAFGGSHDHINSDSLDDSSL